MIRTSCLLLMLASSSIVLAQPLYKWVEPDGAITFSPTQPPAGTSYEIVNDTNSESSQPAKEAAISPTQDKPVLQSNASEPASVQTDAPRIKMTPTPGEINNAQKSDAVSAVTALSSGDSTIQGTSTDAFRSVQENSAIRKQRQCQDLRKRVISLERRLKSRLTPEDMDNTVVHMARYQRSYDQHCVQ